MGLHLLGKSLSPAPGPQPLIPLPATSGRISYFGGSEESQSLGLTMERSDDPRIDRYYCAMRWDYTNLPMTEKLAAKSWLSKQRILVTHPNGKKVVVRPADWGPAEWTGRVLDVSYEAMRALSAKTDDVVSVQWTTVTTTGPV